jgi:predicted metal-dependent hydrolase
MKSAISEYKGVPVYINKKSIKHMYVRIKTSGCHINIPKKLSSISIEKYLYENVDKIKETYNNLKTISYSILGKPISVSYTKGEFKFDFSDNHLTIVHPTSFDEGFKLFLKISMTTYIKKYDNEIKSHLTLFNITPVNYHFKYLTSKFGSYHRVKKTITLNTYLFMLDPLLIHYVLMHEYAHTKEFHHQKSFYDLQHQLCPNDKELSKRLKTLTIPSQFTL